MLPDAPLTGPRLQLRRTGGFTNDDTTTFAGETGGVARCHRIYRGTASTSVFWKEKGSRPEFLTGRRCAMHNQNHTSMVRKSDLESARVTRLYNNHARSELYIRNLLEKSIGGDFRKKIPAFTLFITIVYFSLISTDLTVTGLTGRELSPPADRVTGAVAIASTASIPLITFPKIT